MKFKKLTLDEALFGVDDDFNDTTFEFDSNNNFNTDDDIFSVVDDIDEEHSVENTLPGPKAGADTGVASELIALINDEWEAIQGYNNAIASLRATSTENAFYLDAIKVLEEISAEENRHVGQLQEVLKHISPNAQEINLGQNEAKSQLKFVNGKLPVESHQPYTPAENDSPSITSEMSDMCTLDNCDDEF